ncbi:hypothetical protein LTR53_016677 [Teratosphaeriaceae sp. CCFEE 6253]|nr:hypothetical protein LTR53_016677 [Teratosphaeriaceae sp. CCFEE 6253]
MELFILGPAFGLPSIDAECVAAVALLQRLNRNDWTLVPTHDDRRGLPLLVSNGSQICGFTNIARHLEAEQRSGDAVAISSFLERGAQTLLDISLYVSFENYSATRSAFTAILPWHANYILPPRRRAAARTRTEHLGISSIDVDTVHEDLSGRPSGADGVGKEQVFEVEAQKRASLLLPRKDTLRSLLRKPERSAVFKLHALADNFFGPLQDLLGDRDFLLGAEMAGVDCLAYGYLALMLYPHMPQDWLATTMRRKYAKLVAYVDRLHNRLGMQTNTEAAMALAQDEPSSDVKPQMRGMDMALPWQRPARSTFLDRATMTIEELISHIPILRPSTSITSIRTGAQLWWQRLLPAILTLTAVSLALGISAAVKTGILAWPHGEQLHVFGRKRLSDYGHLGAALAGMSVLSQQPRGSSDLPTAQEDEGKAVLLDVEVEATPNAVA